MRLDVFVAAILVLFLCLPHSGARAADGSCTQALNSLSAPVNSGPRTATAFELFNRPYTSGEKIRIKGKEYVVADVRVPVGSRGSEVFKVYDKSGRAFALKVVDQKSGNANIIAKAQATLREEVEVFFPLLRRLKTERFGLAYPEIIASGKDYILRKWSEGQLGTDWFEEWIQHEQDPAFPGYRELVTINARLIKRGVLLGLLPDNMVWTGKEWEIFDLESDRIYGHDRDELYDYSLEIFEDSWGSGSPFENDLIDELIALDKRKSGKSRINGTGR